MTSHSLVQNFQNEGHIDTSSFTSYSIYLCPFIHTLLTLLTYLWYPLGNSRYCLLSISFCLMTMYLLSLQIVKCILISNMNKVVLMMTMMITMTSNTVTLKSKCQSLCLTCRPVELWRMLQNYSNKMKMFTKKTHRVGILRFDI